MKPFRRLAFVVNEDKSGAVELARTLMAVARRRGVTHKFTTRFPIVRGFLRG
ncbi:MAG: ATP-NAD/AcoX kinase, partial [Verrucomicrobia bacterium]|nr:ATP-NAD/AcoX kinase [Verrucomicrobiota bacterium]